MLPQNTSQVLQFMFPGVDPLLFGVSESPEKPLPGGGTRPRETTISGWRAPATQPTESEIIAAAATPEFAAWLDARSTPAKDARRRAIEMTANTSDPALMLARVQAKITRTTLAAVINKLNTLLPPAERLPSPRTFAQLVNVTKAKLATGEGENDND